MGALRLHQRGLHAGSFGGLGAVGQLHVDGLLGQHGQPVQGVAQRLPAAAQGFQHLQCGDDGIAELYLPDAAQAGSDTRCMAAGRAMVRHTA